MTDTIQGLGKTFMVISDGNKNGIGEREFSKAVREYGFNISDEELKILMKA